MEKDEEAKLNTKPATLEDCWAVISRLTEIITRQAEEISKLKVQLNLNSNNSSLPPSKDFKKKKAKAKKAASGKSEVVRPDIMAINASYFPALKQMKL